MDEKATFFAGVVAIGVVAVVMVILCILCKFCLASKKAQKWSGLYRLLVGDLPKNQIHLDKPAPQLVSDESQFMLKMQQGHYVGYEALEKDVCITKLPEKLSKENSRTDQERMRTPSLTLDEVLTVHHDITDKDMNFVDMEALKRIPSAPESGRLQVKAARPRLRHHSHSFHNSYTIYEETSDLSGAESGVVDDDSDSDSESSTGAVSGSNRVSSVRSSVSCESFTSTIDLLELHKEISDIGQVEYSLTYESDSEQLVLYIIQARNLDLPASFNGDKLDCFIKSFATNCHDNEPKKQTKICKATTNPIFKEKFLFRVAAMELQAAIVTMQVFTRDQYARQKLIGEVSIDLLPLTSTTYYETWSSILDYDHQPLSSCADMDISLLYDFHAEVLHVAVKELKSLKLESSPVYQYKELYIAVTLILDETNPLEKKRTAAQSVMTSDQATTFEHSTLLFKGVPKASIKDTRVVIELCQQFPDKSHDTIGYNVIGSNTTGAQYGHWLMMCSGNNKGPVSMWHKAHVVPCKHRHKPRFILRL